MTDGPVPVDIEVLDTKVRLSCVGGDGKRVAEVVRRAWSRCLMTDGGVPDVIMRLGTEPGQTGLDLVEADLDRLMHNLSPLVTVRAIDQQAGRLLMLHAAGLADPNTGRAIALVGPSGTGKTTAILRLGRTWGYLSDETVGVRENGTVAAYPKPLSVLPETGHHLKAQVSPDELGLVPAPEPCWLAAIVILARDGSPDAWLEEVPLLEALARLAPETSSLARLQHPLHWLAGVIDGVGGVRVLHYADRAQLSALVDDLLVQDR